MMLTRICQLSQIKISIEWEKNEKIICGVQSPMAHKS